MHHKKFKRSVILKAICEKIGLPSAKKSAGYFTKEMLLELITYINSLDGIHLKIALNLESVIEHNKKYGYLGNDAIETINDCIKQLHSMMCKRY